jgi:RNA 3'-phosphate cyclase
MITIDGTIGGGSVLRVALPLALSKKQSVKVINIRSNRKKPGLRNQHLQGVQLLAQITGAKLEGDYIGSTSINFELGGSDNNMVLSENGKKCYKLKIDTAASMSLIFQIVSNYVFASCRSITVLFDGGGTHTNWAPTFDYLKHVSRPVFSLFGQSIDIHLDRLGFYPKGGAKGGFTVSSSLQDQKIVLEGNKIEKIILVSIASNHLKNAQVADRQIKGFEKIRVVQSQLINYHNTVSPGSSLLAVMKLENGAYKGVSVLGKKGVPAEIIGEEVAKKVSIEFEADHSIDDYLADQLIVPLVFAPSRSSYTFGKMTDHIQTNLNLVEQLMGDVLILEELEKSMRLTKK